MKSPSNRRLAAILAADVAGYSRLTAADEEGTVAALRAIRSEVIEPLTEQYGGRIANTAGDSFLIEFRSAVDALRAALSIQDRLRERNAGVPEDDAILLRIGLNVGDVISNGADILGDGVNVAARLEALAEPGGITASEAVAGYARKSIAADFIPMGPQRVKNIPEPVEAYRVRASGQTPQKTARAKAPRARLAVGAGILAAAAAGTLLWMAPSQPNPDQAVVARMAFPLPDLPSVAVLPLADATGETGNAMLADGFSEDLITDLSRISGLFVISGNSSFAYQERQISTAQFAEELGVRYVVDGSLRRTGAAFRANIRLTDTSSGQLVWAERFDGPLENIFSVQNRIALDIAKALDLPLDDEERTGIEQVDTATIAAREAFQQGWALFARFNEADNLAAIPHFKQAVSLDPDYGRAWALLAMAHLRPHILHHWEGYSPATGQTHIGEFYKYLREAVRHGTPLTHVIRAMVLLNLPDWEGVYGGSRGTSEARQEAAKAIALQPSDPEAHLTMGWALIAAGEPQEGLAFVRAAMRLDPRHPSYYALFEAAALFAMGDYAQAAAVLQAEVDRNPQARELMPVAASALAMQGELRAARAMVERWHGSNSSASLPAAVQDYFFILRWTGASRHLNRRLKDGLRLAALPPGTTVASLRAELSLADASSQRQAARSLSLFGPAAAPAVPELTMLLQSPSAFVRKEAANTLGNIGTAAAPALAALDALAGMGLAGKRAALAAERIRSSLAAKDL
ncbi:adenylate/guanylate cyclase domain-containing protein [Leisingera sp. S132]|uniref:adenylate/guanylate cyclase domain-containing protein n=1 Tax=Leisingera sp. S132 TaxID=2867016 RepID=UPI0021A86006|nr:tetratricopeptide repeat protein [Leisingera sp. S132]UWQ79952.1 adenylate/guanylate cyclase domain-containing protein [Leisingera sp. S132]